MNRCLIRTRVGGTLFSFQRLNQMSFALMVSSGRMLKCHSTGTCLSRNSFVVWYLLDGNKTCCLVPFWTLSCPRRCCRNFVSTYTLCVLTVSSCCIWSEKLPIQIYTLICVYQGYFLEGLNYMPMHFVTFVSIVHKIIINHCSALDFVS